MADNLIPSPPSEKGSNGQSGNDSPGKEHASKPEDKLDSSQGNEQEQGLNRAKWAGFFGDIFVILWIWSDLIICRDYARLIFLLAALLVAHGILAYFIFRSLKSWRWSIVIWLGLCLPASFIAFDNSRPLMPAPIAQWLPPELPTNCIDVTMIWGGNFFGDYVSKARNTNLPIDYNGVAPFSVRVENNRLYVDCNFFTQDYGFIKIRGNSISPQLPQRWDMNMSSNALEIVDENMAPVFQLFYKRPDEVAINGVFQIGGMVWFASDKHLEYFGTNNVDYIKASQSNFKALTDRVRPIFKYPAWNHKGQMVGNPN
jgi:hypothetical protein